MQRFERLPGQTSDEVRWKEFWRRATTVVRKKRKRNEDGKRKYESRKTLLPSQKKLALNEARVRNGINWRCVVGIDGAVFNFQTTAGFLQLLLVSLRCWCRRYDGSVILEKKILTNVAERTKRATEVGLNEMKRLQAHGRRTDWWPLRRGGWRMMVGHTHANERRNFLAGKSLAKFSRPIVQRKRR